ncbi:TPA: ImmA/IrrE family metallo-endopeptidase [Staphylococcus aureus]|uniref:ImmA/IrrE family metallo-endopeptidase n=1 Tax=Staphylococcus aureus TaxID=1280 RepID=UPI00071C3526|nr:ImmA/IrrE family metallo-endopeptidase [Staphylococcus aureus]KSA78452.1 toxin [Staphylococcus aureus]HDE3253547.1 ImmA/IrrE family metallo-endopeptidase [Staphylococcus aureus]HDE4429822.1 ImmA/IrrE family metallo-endopeptidase [Staphylococcus aureus]HDF1412196.1 ImmA/IrrE family metallo-endopeptidase [Staphylococcus aureus]HDF1492568.1 ImmA/IrrE family metallo-endopeptidase [Staphylococcus aureus]
MYLYEKMVIENKEIPIDDRKSLGNFEGLYDNGVILINKNLSETRKAEVLYEELAHHKLTYGNILDQSKWINRKFENYARRHGFISAVPLREIVEAYNYGVRNLYELSEYLQLSEKYILEAIEQYKKIYGIGTHYGEYSITFEPLRVFKYKEI